MTIPVRKIDPVLSQSFEAFYRQLNLGAPSALETPIKGIEAICERFGITRGELAAWRRMAFPLYNVKGLKEKEKWWANPERVMAWFRWREGIQSGQIPRDPTAPDV